MKKKLAKLLFISSSLFGLYFTKNALGSHGFYDPDVYNNTVRARLYYPIPVPQHAHNMDFFYGPIPAPVYGNYPLNQNYVPIYLQAYATSVYQPASGLFDDNFVSGNYNIPAPVYPNNYPSNQSYASIYSQAYPAPVRQQASAYLNINIDYLLGSMVHVIPEVCQEIEYCNKRGTDYEHMIEGVKEHFQQVKQQQPQLFDNLLNATKITFDEIRNQARRRRFDVCGLSQAFETACQQIIQRADQGIHNSRHVLNALQNQLITLRTTVLSSSSLQSQFNAHPISTNLRNFRDIDTEQARVDTNEIIDLTSSIRTSSSTQASDINIEQSDFQTPHRTHISDLPNEILIEILQKQDVSKATTLVCRQWEELKYDRVVPPTLWINSETRLKEILNYTSVNNYFKFENFKFHNFTPSSEQIAELVKKFNPVSVDLSGCSDFSDASALGKVRILNLSNTNVTDVSALGQVHTLDLSGTDVTDVSALGKVHTLNLSSNILITDVSALSQVYALDLHWTRVTDVSALGQVHKLNLSWTLVTDVSALGKVRILDLSDTDVTDVSALGQVHKLNLRGTLVKDFSALSQVRVLYTDFGVGFTGKI